MDPETKAELKKRFESLPPVVRDAITSADVQKQLREVSESHKLHVDQWAKLENEVMLTLLGFEDAAKFPQNLQSEVGVSVDEAAALASDVNKIVFEPIREELERGLSHPEAKEKEVTDAEAARASILTDEAKAATVVLPATPPPPPPTEKAIRAPISSSYSSREPSSRRKDVSGDPYRELPA